MSQINEIKQTIEKLQIQFLNMSNPKQQARAAALIAEFSRITTAHGNDILALRDAGKIK